MLALSIRQPHIHDILEGKKTVEYRAWKYAPKVRGLIALHASLKVDWHCMDDAEMESRVWEIGGILGVVEVVDACIVKPKQLEIYLKSPRRIKPVRYIGKLGFFPVTGAALEAIERQLK